MRERSRRSGTPLTQPVLHWFVPRWSRRPKAKTPRPRQRARRLNSRKRQNFRAKTTQKNRAGQCASRIRTALVAADKETWRAASAVFRARLTREERIALLATTVDAVDDEDLEPTLDGMLGGAGEPLPWFISPLDEAQTWATFASSAERAAYAAESFLAMPPADRRAFLARAGRWAA